MKRFGVVLILLLTSAGRTYSQSASTSDLRVERLMSAEEFRTAGLQKLSPEELTVLNAWLQKFAHAALQASDGAPSRSLANSLSGRWLSLDTNTVRVLHEDRGYVYGELFTRRDEKTSIGTYDLAKQPDGTISGRGKMSWSCKFLCRDISCDIPRDIENSCTLDQEVVILKIEGNRIEGYVVAAKPPDSLDKAYASFCRKCGAQAPKVKQPFAWVRIE